MTVMTFTSKGDAENSLKAFWQPPIYYPSGEYNISVKWYTPNQKSAVKKYTIYLCGDETLNPVDNQKLVDLTFVKNRYGSSEVTWENMTSDWIVYEYFGGRVTDERYKPCLRGTPKLYANFNSNGELSNNGLVRTITQNDGTKNVKIVLTNTISK